MIEIDIIDETETLTEEQLKLVHDVLAYAGKKKKKFIQVLSCRLHL